LDEWKNKGTLDDGGAPLAHDEMTLHQEHEQHMQDLKGGTEFRGNGGG
jgi:hypothetical protein